MTAKERREMNREMLKTFRASASAEMKKLIDCLMMLNIEEQKKAQIDISIGKSKPKNAFLTYLSSRSKEPITKISSNGTHPQIIVYGHPSVQNILAVIDLPSINKITIYNEQGDNSGYSIRFVLSVPNIKLDYQIVLGIPK